MDALKDSWVILALALANAELRLPWATGVLAVDYCFLEGNFDEDW